MSEDHGALLPNGMVDSLPARAESESRVSMDALRVFANFGYRQVNPPLVEFEDSLLTSAGGQAIAKNMFRLMDPVSRRMMAIRSDATIQIARLAASRLKSIPRPLRLSYMADVLRVEGTQLRPERQFRQVGCEMLGSASIEASVEAAFLAVHALRKIGVPQVSIDFAAPEIVRDLALKAKKKDDFIRAAQLRDEDALKKAGDEGKLLIKLNQAAGEADAFFAQVKKMTLAPAAKKSIARLQAVVTGLRDALRVYGMTSTVTITIDVLETKGFDYQTSPSFTLFSRGVRGELGRGGFYEAAFPLNDEKAHAEPANGFTLYVDTILRSIPEETPVRRIFAPAKTSWDEIRMLQTEGFSVIRGSDDAKVPKDLTSLECTHVYKNGKITNLEE